MNWIVSVRPTCVRKVSYLFPYSDVFQCFCLLFLDIDECQTNPCHVNANCTDVEGSYECQCKTGFSGDGVICTSKTSFHTFKVSHSLP